MAVISSLIIIVATIVACWNWFRDTILQSIVRPILERVLGVEKSQWFVDFIVWLDKEITLTRRAVKIAWDLFKTRVLNCTSHYTKLGTGEVCKKTTETVMLDANGGTLVRRKKEEVTYEDLPQEFRSEMIRLNEKSVSFDNKAVIEERFRKRCLEENIDPIELEVGV